MDRTEKESSVISQSESSNSEGTVLDQNDKNTKVESFEEDSADTESDDLDTKGADTNQLQEQNTPSHAESDDNPESTLRNTGGADLSGDITNPGEESDEFSMQAEPPDTTETGQTDVKGDIAEQPPEDLDPQTTGDTVDQKPDHADADVETAESAADDAAIINAEASPSVDSTPSDGDADQFDQQQGSPEEEGSSEFQEESQTSENPVDGTAGPPPADDDQQAVSHEKETLSQAAAAKTSIKKIAVSAVLITALFSGFFIFENKSKMNTDETVAEAPMEDQPQPFIPENKQIVEIMSAVAPSIYDDPINEVSVLRDSLLKKQAEVIALKKRYRQSIEELEKEILDEQRKADVQTFLQATNHNRIVFSLKTIQRRQAYIRQLEKPLQWVSGACEELLFLKRRVQTDLRVSAIASGIDMDSHVRQMHRALKEYRPTADKLAIDPTDAHLESLETIWQRIQEKQDLVSAEPVYSKNQIISAQICAGDFNRLGELSEITAETARCITEMQASDLFLNQINEISPGAARQLCQWKGSWICMNGIRALSPRVAHYLFQWDGHWISLNGLTEFPAELGEALLKWQGRQLELMGLLDTADSRAQIGIEYLAEWERSGGKLFVPENLRKKIDALNQQSG